MARQGLEPLLFATAAGVLIAAGASGSSAPVNDAFINSTVLGGLTNFVLASNEGATGEPGEPQHAGSTGGSSLWWTWTAPESGTFSASTAGSSFDTLLAVYLGSSLSNLMAVASNDDSDPDGSSL